MKDDMNEPSVVALELETSTRSRGRRASRGRPRPVPTREPKPTHYKVICISMYTRDIEQLDAKVAELKRRGFTKANKSQLIRIALSQLEVESVADSSRDELERAA